MICYAFKGGNKIKFSQKPHTYTYKQINMNAQNKYKYIHMHIQSTTTAAITTHTQAHTCINTLGK